MSSISNFMMKKNIPIGFKPKKKSIPININSNPVPGKFLISNQINPVASSYLSMGQKIQNSKNLKNSKLIHVNTNSAINYYTNPGIDSKYTNNSITNSLLNNYPNINSKNSEINGINFNNYFNNVSQHDYSGNSGIDKNIVKYNNINYKARKHISTISNSLIPNDIHINGYQSSKNNNNSNIILNNKYINHINNNNINGRPKSKIISTNSKTNLSKIKQTYSQRQNFLDSRNKTKKISVKSKIRQYKYQYKNNKPVSTSFSNVYMNKNNNIQNSEHKDLFNYVRVDLMNNMNKENLGNNNVYSKINTIGNNIINNNLYEIKGRHFRHNTASFDNRDIINIFHKNNLLDKSNKNINHININNNIGFKGNNNICINNINSTKNSNSIHVKNNLNNEIIPHSNIGFKISNINNIRKKSGQFVKTKNVEGKIYIKDRRNNVKENIKYNPNVNNTGINSNYIYHNYHTNNGSTYNHVIHHIKNSRSINMNITGIKKISIKQKDPKKNNLIKKENKLINKPIPAPVQKMKGNIIPSQRNIKINLTKFLEDVKTKQNSKVIGRKSLSIKRFSKENNSDFSISQLNDKFGQKILKNNEEGNDLKNYASNASDNKKLISKTIQEEKKEKEKEKEKNNDGYECGIIIDTNYISNMQNNEVNKKVSSNMSNKISQNKANNNNKINNHHKINYNMNSTNNNNYFGKNKIDYSIDNPPDISNNSNINNANQLFTKDKENINDMNINNITDIINPNSVNDKNYTHENIIHKKLDFEENNSLSSEKPTNKTKQKEINEDMYSLKTKDSSKKKSSKKAKDNKIHNTLFDEDNLDDLPEDYDEEFNDLYSIINKMNFSNVLVCVEGLFTPEGRTYKKFKDKFDKFYDNLYSKKRNSFANSNMKPKKKIEGLSVTSNTKTNSSSSKKNVINNKYNDLNIVKDLNVY